MSDYHMLLSPIKLNSTVTLKNRMIKSGQSTWWWNEDGTVSERGIRGYESIAAGGASAIVIAALLWEPAAGRYLFGSDDKYIPGLKQLTDAIHKYDCQVFAQIHHMGPSAWASLGGGLPIGPSDLSVDEIPTPPPYCNAVRGISIDEIHEKQQQIIDTAYRAKQAGFDGVEVHAAHGYFLASFMTRVFNKRTDEYGCQNVENRTRIIREIFDGIRKKCGKDFLMGIRLNGQEFGAKNALTIEEAVENSKALTDAGAEFISVSGYGFGPLAMRYCPDYFPYPEPEPHMAQYMDRYKGQGLWVEPAARIKKAVNVPVIVAGRMNEDLAEKILEQGSADIIALGRTLWADPEFPNKVKEGRPEDIVRCTRCASCEDPVTSPRICRVNPSLGRDKELEITPAKKKKKVMVVGGGPAGMEAARVAALRGHDVTIYDKAGSLGGRIKLASMIKGTDVENVLPIYDYLTTQLKKLGVKKKMRTEVTPVLVQKERPDAVIVANSASYPVPDIPGIGGRNVSSVKSLSAKVKLPMRVFGPEMLSTLTHLFLPIGKKVVVLGGQIEALQGAVFLKKRGRDVVVVEESDTLGTGIPQRYLVRMFPWFKEKGVEILTETKCLEVTKKGVVVQKKDGSKDFIKADSVMVLMPQVPSQEYATSLKPYVQEVHVVGSSLGPEHGLLKHALLDGRTVGCTV